MFIIKKRKNYIFKGFFSVEGRLLKTLIMHEPNLLVIKLHLHSLLWFYQCLLLALLLSYFTFYNTKMNQPYTHSN